MKKGIFLTVAALGLALFAVPDAHGWWNRGPDVNQRFSGSTFTIDVDDGEGGTGNSTAMINAIAKGQPGSAHLDSIVVFGPVGPHGSCPGQLGADVISQNSVERYSDGSLLTLLTDPGAVLCTPDGIVFTIEGLTGVITGGTGRFEGASGTFEAEAATANSGITGRLTADFD